MIDTKDPKLTAKERARQIRHEAYARQKERMARDPRTLARKEMAKQQRREAYERTKAKRQAVAAEQKSKKKVLAAEARSAERARSDRQLMAKVAPCTPAPAPSPPSSPSLEAGPTGEPGPPAGASPDAARRGHEAPPADEPELLSTPLGRRLVAGNLFAVPCARPAPAREEELN